MRSRLPRAKRTLLPALLLLAALLAAGCGRAAEVIPGGSDRTPTATPPTTPTPLVAPPIIAPSGAGVSGSASAPGNAIPDAQLAGSVVQLQFLDYSGAGPLQARVGSGVVVDRAQRLVLTSYALAEPFRADGTPAYSTIAVAVAPAAGAAPVPRFEADIVAANPQTDIAVLRVARVYQGGAVDPGAFTIPAPPLGSSDALKLGNLLRIFGYPAPEGGVAAGVLAITGSVTGFHGQAGVEGRTWIKTDARVGAAAAGGPVFDAAGALVGITSQLRYNARAAAGGVRPLALALAPIEQARKAGPEARYAAPLEHSHLLPGRSSAAADDGIVVTTPAFALNAVAGDRTLDLFDYARSFPTPPQALYYEYTAQGVPDGTSVEERWYLQGVLQDGLSSSFAWSAGTFGTVADRLVSPNPRGMPSGQWLLEVWVGGALRAAAGTYVGAPPTTRPAVSKFSFGSAVGGPGSPTAPSGLARQLLAFFDYQGTSGSAQLRWIVFRNGQVVYQSPVVPWAGGDSGRWWVGYSAASPIGGGFWEIEVYLDSPTQPQPVSRGSDGVQLS